MTEMQREDFFEEIADIVIRAIDLAGYYEYPLGEAIVNKINKNCGRPFLHGKRY